jgi:hypothetical protein
MLAEKCGASRAPVRKKTARKNGTAATVAWQRNERNSASGPTESIINSAAKGDDKREQTPLVVRRTIFSPTPRKI